MHKRKYSKDFKIKIYKKRLFTVSELKNKSAVSFL